MRILYATPAYKPAYRFGGPIVTVSKAAEGLARRGHEVTVFTTNCDLDRDLDVPLNQPLEVDGVRVWYFHRYEPFKRWLPFVPYLSRSVGVLYAPLMRGALTSAVPAEDVVHTQLPFVYPTWAAGGAARRFRRALFYQQRGVFDRQRLKFRSFKKRVIIQLVERRLMQAATTLVALTSAEVESYRALGIDTPCRIVPNGVEPSDYATAATPAAVAQFGIGEHDLVVLFLGRLHPIKGADRLLEAFAAVGTRFPTARLVMAGPDEWNLARAFESQMRAAGLGDRVAFPGMVTGEAKRNLLARANLFCLPSDGEGFSVAVLEALASATAVLLSPGCHFPEVEAAGAGRMVTATPDTLAEAIGVLLSDPARLQAMGERGRAMVLRDYSWDAVVSRLESVYREGLERRGQ